MRKYMLSLGSLGSFVNGTTIAIISPRFKRRTMFLTGAIGMLCVYLAWLIAVRYAVKALDAGTTNKAAGIVVLFFIYFYSPVSILFAMNMSRRFLPLPSTPMPEIF